MNIEERADQIVDKAVFKWRVKEAAKIERELGNEHGLASWLLEYMPDEYKNDDKGG